MLLDHISHVLTAILENKIFNIWKPIKKIKLFKPFTCNLSPKHIKNLAICCWILIVSDLFGPDRGK